MKKFALALLLGLVAGVTQADLMLYWSVAATDEYKIPDQAIYAALYAWNEDSNGVMTDAKGKEISSLSGLQALDSIVIGSAVDTNITGYDKTTGYDTEVSKYMISLFNSSGTQIATSKPYLYEDIITSGNTWYTDTMSMKADAAVVLNSKMQFVPEPTSGLLMLLGLAGLALKRKRV